MRTILTAVAGSLLLSLFPSAAAPQQRPEARPEPPRVRLQLLGGRDAIAPGDSFLVGLRYKLSPHWHIYWKNPGDSGLATEATLEAPDGFEVGPLLFPGPMRLPQPGDLVNFGYEDEVVLFWTVTAPDELGDATVFRFEARSKWLVCREECERGDGKAALTIPRSTQEHPGREVLEAFGASLLRLPKPFMNLAGAEARWEGSPDEPVLVQVAPATGLYRFYPELEEGVEFVRESVETLDERCFLRRWYSLRPTLDHPVPRVRGLLAVERKDGTAFYDLDLTRPRAHEKETR
ncbi:MAG: hypothetical protein H6831_02650 [Planctomycetes bacterium]|nr:hypothetical protein [Planctomycetota bacterium]MCB9903283.1 hypothetical protein [Planctomycetota bacterium]